MNFIEKHLRPAFLWELENPKNLPEAKHAYIVSTKLSENLKYAGLEELNKKYLFRRISENLEALEDYILEREVKRKIVRNICGI